MEAGHDDKVADGDDKSAKVVDSVDKRRAEQSSKALLSEARALSRHLNHELQGDALARSHLPINVDDDNDFPERVADGVLHCAFMNSVHPDAIPSVRIKCPARNRFEMAANQRLYLDAARRLGYIVINVGENDLVDARHHLQLVIGLLWQLLDRQLLERAHRTLGHDHDVTGDLALRWFNEKLALAGAPLVANLHDDLADGRAYMAVLTQLGARQPIVRGGDAVIAMARSLGVNVLIGADDIARGHPLVNLAFVVSLIAWEETRPSSALPSVEVNVAPESTIAPLVAWLEQRATAIKASRAPSLTPAMATAQPDVVPLPRWLLPMAVTGAWASDSALPGFWVWFSSATRYGHVRPRPDAATRATVNGDASALTTHWTTCIRPSFESVDLDVFAPSTATGTKELIPSLASGLLGVGIARTVVAPLERLQAIRQVSGRPFPLLVLFEAEGFRALWRGHPANLCRLVPYTAVHFLCTPTSVTSRDLWTGLAATLAAGLALYPLDVAQTCLAVSRSSSTSYDTIRDVLGRAVWRHGLPGLYRGIGPHAIGTTAFVATSAAVYPEVRQDYGMVTGTVAAALLSTVVTFPFRVVGRRMQAHVANKGPMPSAWSVAVNPLISARGEGVTFLYRGLGAAIVKTVPGTAIAIGTAEALKHVME